jgi:hypothetical protein
MSPAKLSAAKNALAATSGNSFGWFGGGSPTTSNIDRLNFAAETLAMSPAKLSAAKTDLEATNSI